MLQSHLAGVSAQRQSAKNSANFAATVIAKYRLSAVQPPYSTPPRQTGAIMLCPQCYGKHVVLINNSWIPCPECGGIGELHCCDGLREQDGCRFASAPTTRSVSGFVELPRAETVTSPEAALATGADSESAKADSDSTERGLPVSSSRLALSSRLPILQSSS